jgi:competence CoiA-like predicted nuclease
MLKNKEIIRKLSAYMETPEGQEHLLKVEALVKILKKQEKVTLEQLLQPITI